MQPKSLKYCADCGNDLEHKTPPGDNRTRATCPACDAIHYQNPKVIVGAVCYYGEQILLCRRAIEPRRGFWTLPAGFMELGETAEDGAKREAMEEAHAQIAIDYLLASYSVVHVGQVQLFYMARLLDPNVSPGLESLDVKLCRYDEIPWADLAFPTVHWAIEHARQARNAEGYLPPAKNPDGPVPTMRSGGA